MNKILKIIIKNDPVFKYIVEDYPFYEGLFFHLIDFYSMNILNIHYTLRKSLLISQANTKLFYKPKYVLRLISNLNVPQIQMLVNYKFRMKLKPKFYTFNTLKTHTRFRLSLEINNKDSLKSTAYLHMIKYIRLKTHDPYTLENRGMLKLSNMDAEKIL